MGSKLKTPAVVMGTAPRALQPEVRELRIPNVCENSYLQWHMNIQSPFQNVNKHNLSLNQMKKKSLKVSFDRNTFFLERII